MDNTNLIMRAKIGVHNQGKVVLETQGYDDKTIECSVQELRNDGYKVTIGKTNDGPTIIVERLNE